MSVLAYVPPPQTFSDGVADLLEKVDYRLALTEADREAIFRLRYQAYLREGAITPNFSRRFSDKYDDSDNSWIFGVYIDGQLASSIRIHVATAAYPEMPALGPFSDILVPELESSKVIIDPTRFVTNAEASRAYPDLRFATVRVPYIACEFFGADLLLATVRSEHQAFYRRTFGHVVAAEARPYPTLTKPLSLMTLDYFAMKDRVVHRYPFFRSTAFERRMLFDVATARPMPETAVARRTASGAPAPAA